VIINNTKDKFGLINKGVSKMTIYETIESMHQNLALEQASLREDYFNAESEMIKTFGEFIEGEFVDCNVHGTGEVIKTSGTLFEEAIIDIDFGHCVKRFSLNHVIINASFVRFKNPVITEVYHKILAVHIELTHTFRELMEVARRAQIEAEKKAAAEKKAEVKYQQQKEKAIRDFDNFTKQTNIQSEVDDFYYALGWLTAHVGTITAALPDYLQSSFAQYFGAEAPCQVIDSKKRTINGNSMQWTWSFKATLKKPELVPSILTQYLNTTGKTIANTSFVWDLVDNYGFTFGKKQDVNKIRQTIPVEYLAFYEAGLAE
jgi:hypothetical protein